MRLKENLSFNNDHSTFDDNRVKPYKSASKKPNRKLEIEIRKSTLIIRYSLFIRNRPDDLIPRCTIFFSSSCRPLASLQLPAFMTFKINLTLYPANTYIIFRSQNLPVSSIFYPSSSNVFPRFSPFHLIFCIVFPSSSIFCHPAFICFLYETFLCNPCKQWLLSKMRFEKTNPIFKTKNVYNLLFQKGL